RHERRYCRRYSAEGRSAEGRSTNAWPSTSGSSITRSATCSAVGDSDDGRSLTMWPSTSSSLVVRSCSSTAPPFVAGSGDFPVSTRSAAEQSSRSRPKTQNRLTIGAPVPTSVRERLAESRRAFAAVFTNPGLRRVELSWAGTICAYWIFIVTLSLYAYEQ